MVLVVKQSIRWRDDVVIFRFRRDGLQYGMPFAGEQSFHAWLDTLKLTIAQRMSLLRDFRRLTALREA